MFNTFSQWLKNFSKNKTTSEFLVSFLVVSVVVIIKELGVFEYPELTAYDRLLRLHSNKGKDDRILTVLITEDDIQAIQQWPISDANLAKAISMISQHKPHGIGVDLYRDFPVEPGSEELDRIFANSKNISVVCKLPSNGQPAVPPPPSLPKDLVGFADIVIDGDGVVRRNLFYVQPRDSRCSTPYSLGLQMALSYLIPNGIEPEISEAGFLTLGKTTLKPINQRTGIYRNIDSSGYQIMLDYRRGENPTPTVTLSEVLAGKVDPQLITDKVVLIGVSAVSLKDTFYTPFSRKGDDVELMPGVTLHSYMTSQLLSSAIDGFPLIWDWPEVVEFIWIYFWGIVGGASITLISRPFLMLLGQTFCVAIIIGSGIFIFSLGGWIPIVSPLMAFLVGAIALLGYHAYEGKQEQLLIQQQVAEQETSIAVLQMLLRSQSQATTPSLVQSYEEGSVIFRRYEIVKRLGRGGFGNTYLSIDRLLPGKPYCVVKRLNAYSDDPKILKIIEKLLETEAKILEQVGKNDKIPDLLAYIQENDQFFLIQEYMEGKTLGEELRHKGKYTENEVLQVIEEMMNILSFIEQYNLIHRDIKPDNIIRRKSDKSLVLIDFGAIKQIFNLKDDQQYATVSNEGYASPEQIAGQPVMSSDIYAVGMVAIHCLTGVFPYKLPKNPQTGEVIWDSEKYASPITTQIIQKMTCYHFSDRYQNAQEVIKDLKQYRTQIEEVKNAIDIEIQIDEEKKAEEVAEILQSTDFIHLQEKAERLRRKRLG